MLVGQNAQCLVGPTKKKKKKITKSNTFKTLFYEKDLKICFSLIIKLATYFP